MNSRHVDQKPNHQKSCLSVHFLTGTIERKLGDHYASHPRVVLIFVVMGRICITKLVLFVQLH